MDTPASAGMPELLSFRDGCAFLRISTATADRWLRHPHSSLPRPFRIGGRKFFLRSHLIAWLEVQARRAAAA
jgi:predicted DNA-binding transcriptional regulator AlpA